MEALVVEPGDVFDDSELELCSGAQDAVADQLGLEAVDEALRGRVIECIPDRADRGEHAVVVKGLGVVELKLPPGVAVMDERDVGSRVAFVHHSDAGGQLEFDYTQTLDDHGVLASIGSVGDAFDNATAESFVDSFKTELIRDRVLRTRTQLELAVVEYVAWFNNERLHTSLAGIPPAEFEQQHARR